jgi:hypothetical protein
MIYLADGHRRMLEDGRRAIAEAKQRQREREEREAAEARKAQEAERALLAPIPISIAGEFNLLYWQRTTRSPLPFHSAITPKPAD